MPKKTTIYDVAKTANVAISTVSRVLNDSPYVSADTKEKVKKAIAELHFRPQVNARKLARREPQIIAVAVPTFTTPFFNEVLKGIKDEIKDIDLDFVIYNTGSENPENTFKTFLDRGIPDAIVAISIEIDDEINDMMKSFTVPVILVGSNHPDYNYLYWDNYQGGYISAEHLAKKGHKKIGMIRSHSRSKISDERERGFRDALKKYDLELNEDYLVSGITTKHAGFSEEAGYEAIKILRDREAIPDAIFCSNDAQAVGAIYALKELGLRVPEDVAVMGYDNIKISRYVGLTTVDQKMYDVGIKAIKRLAELFKNPEQKPMQSVINPTLIERQTA